MEEYFSRTISLVGEEAFRRLRRTRVILFGVGGVGGWCAESLVRSGIGHLSLVDFDTVAPSNINRQVVATSGNIGLKKVSQMRERLLNIVPDADIVDIDCRYSCQTASQFDLSSYDYVIDAIDSVDDKIQLILQATQSSATLFSSMGAGRKLDPTQVRITEFLKVQGCPLARTLRTQMRRSNLLPEHPFLCVYSPEISAPSGTLAPVVAAFGFTLSSLVLRDVMSHFDNLPLCEFS